MKTAFVSKLSDISKIYKFHKIRDFCSIIKGKYPIMKTLPGKYPLVATGKDRKSSGMYQIDGKAVCIPLVSSTGHGHASIKRLHYQEGKFALANIMMALLPDEKICIPKYLYYLLSAKKEEYLVRLMHGSANVSLSLEKVSDVEVPLHPISEQKRIVMILDKIDDLKSKREKSFDLINRLKSVMLNDAFSGILTKHWRERNPKTDVNILNTLHEIQKNKKDFQQKYLQLMPSNVKSLPKLPKSWSWTTIGFISESMKNGIYKPQSAYSDQGIACLRMYNIENGELVWKDIKRMVLTEEEILEYELLPDDILVNRVNSRELVGKAARIPDDIERCVYESKNIRLRPMSKFVNSGLVSYWFQVFSQTYFLTNAQQTVGMASINQDQLAQMPIPYMSMEEQIEIVKQLKLVFNIMNKIEKVNFSQLKMALESEIFRIVKREN